MSFRIEGEFNHEILERYCGVKNIKYVGREFKKYKTVLDVVY